ncbi:HAD family hydrolase [Nocardiopsis sp. CNT312]|uniref:HAD family hydrolase n=1 Tax=Nocardiopsis sp. CNT312 TaxID=1137268 RepID=UPI0004B303B3|nr:HAD family hydrolase [Nocardiopsis sp. CNT312]
MESTPAALRRRPDALLLDFGGVVFQTRKRPGGRDDAARHLREVLARAGHDVDTARLRASLDAGLAALKDWKNAAGRRREPVELGHRTLWTDFLASDLPEPVRETLAGSAARLLADMSPLISDHEVRPGIRDLFDAARSLGVRVGMVSNAHSGRSHREILHRAGLEGYFDVQVYSDEVGIRKPHPEMIGLAARALGTVPERCWYVGDTQDRDVVAGRRAGVAGMVLTRHHHTDTPPYPVDVRADAVFDTPEGLVAPLWHSLPEPAPVLTETAAPGGAREAETGMPAALLLDHGGVIALSRPSPEAQAGFAARLADRLARAGYATTADAALELVRAGRDRYRDWKAAHPDGGPVPEITPGAFWTEMVGRDLPERARALLLAESAQLTLEYARTKSRAEPRKGVRRVLELCRDRGVPVAVVSNTVCGRAVREELDRFGVEDLIGVHVYSDELGRRKPDPVTVETAVAALGADPARCWFVGDKPWRDTAAARRAGIGTPVIVRGGSADDESIDAALTGPPDHRPAHVIAEPEDLLALWAGTSVPPNSSLQ